LLTGLSPLTTQIYAMGPEQFRLRKRLPSVITLPQHFTQAGYTTRAIGKIFDPRNVDAGHDAASWSQTYQTDQTVQAVARESARRHGVEPWAPHPGPVAEKPAWEQPDVPDNTLFDGAMTDLAIETLRELATAGPPFFYAVGYLKPHLPFVAPKRYWDLYDPTKLALASYSESPVGHPSQFFGGRYHEARTFALVPDDGPIPEETQRTLLHGYLACVSYMDAQLGRLLDALDQTQAKDNTIIVLWGDHGWHLGDHGRWGKMTHYEEALRAPLIISAPGYAGCQRAEGLTELTDVYPTLCDLAGLPPPSHLQGLSLEPALRDPGVHVRPMAVSYLTGAEKSTAVSVRFRNIRYTEWHLTRLHSQGARTVLDEVLARELYDYTADPLERQNLSSEFSYAEVVAEGAHHVATTLRRDRPEPGR
jgi:arylsulfatase A-like enzyme